MRLTPKQRGVYWTPVSAHAGCDTIVAIATPPGVGGIGVVRVSGPKAGRILAALWRGGTAASDFEPRRLYLGHIVHPGAKPDPIDRAMAVFMPAPRTYTGEDVVEFSCHGSMIVLKRIVDACIASGARPAAPGEFTRRAFMAGKIDLAQAEAVADLIDATGERAARLASDQLNGRLSGEVISIGEMLAAIRAEVEASIDFPEEDIRAEGFDLGTQLKGIGGRVRRISSTFNEGRIIRDGARTAIVGKPNVGKSSLFNALVGTSRAIVHHAPGTTRDVIEECVSIEGQIFKLRDTAGIRRGAGDVEELGIARSMDEIAQADAVIAIFDGSRELGEEDEEVARSLEPSKTVAVINKVDLPQRLDRRELKRWLGEGPLTDISAKEVLGIGQVTARLAELASSGGSDGDSAIITSMRHKELLDRCAKALHAAAISLECEHIECTASHLKEAQDALGEITGCVTTEDILDRIFSQFCIGK